MKKLFFEGAAALALMIAGCEQVDHTGEKYFTASTAVSLDTVARLLSSLPIGIEHLAEVHDAVSSSSDNGYDEEYTMKDLFTSPGAGVGDGDATRALKTRSYSRPLKELIAEHLARTRAAEAVDTGEGIMSPDEYMDALENSDIQIYWPYSEQWDGKEWPVITFDPGNGADVNVGYRIAESEDGFRTVEEVIVDEDMAASRPVWVVNRNDDSGYTSVEMHRREDPEWGTGGGSIVVRPSGLPALPSDVPAETKAGTSVRTLLLKDFKMRRNYDSWFAGASEFFVKCGSVEDFTASTEAELKLYSPQITDFMVVVKRRQAGQTLPMDVVIVSEWTDQLDNVAFMVTEDDGGTRTEWNCSASVKIKSKSYGFEISLPFNTKDDIVWRGQLSASYLDRYDDITSRFGDIEITFQFADM